MALNKPLGRGISSLMAICVLLDLFAVWLIRVFIVEVRRMALSS